MAAELAVVGSEASAGGLGAGAALEVAVGPEAPAEAAVAALPAVVDGGWVAKCPALGLAAAVMAPMGQDR
jgi:hypothetical protein